MKHAHARIGCSLLAATSLTASLGAAQERETDVVNWTTPRTAWGAPDLQGIWDYRTLTPLERPDELDGREFLTHEEVADLEQQRRDRPDGRPPGDPRTAPSVHAPYWLDYGTTAVSSGRSSLIVDPPDGRIPALSTEGLRRAAQRRSARQRRGPADSFSDRNLWERCITRGLPNGMLPAGYNNNIQVLQTPNHVVILNEKKMAALGELAAGIAHEFNNLLMVVQGHGELLAKRLPPEDAGARSVESILRASRRAQSLTRELLAFSRDDAVKPVDLDLNSVVRDADDMLRRLLGDHLDLVTRLAPELGHTRVDCSQVEQVIINLALNARDAMPMGGRLEVAAHNTDIKANDKDRPGRPRSYVVLEVKDDGTGMKSETLSRIFEPFFTTKEDGKGTGLGLSAVHGLVKQARGYIVADSEEGRGSLFRIYNPRVRPAQTTQQPLDPIEDDISGSETILLAEDESELRTLIRDFLRDAGCTVLLGNTGLQGLRLGVQHGGTIDLLVTDMSMPGMMGTELAEALRSRRPDMKVLYMSGYEPGALAETDETPGIRFL